MSGEKVPYHLRQNKFVDRQLFIDVLSHINRVRPIKLYLYISFGGAYLEDFKIVHANFGNEEMLSLEQEPWLIERQKFNAPYGCIECIEKTSAQFLEDYDQIVSEYRSKNVIVWFDYAAPIQTKQIAEYQALLQHMKPFDIVRLTLNANPNTLAEERKGQQPLEPAEHLRERRFEELRRRLGDFLPAGFTADDMRPDTYARLLLGCVRLASLQALAGTPGLLVQPLAVFTYNDAVHQMLTVTSILLEQDRVAEFLRGTGIDRYEFASTDWERIVPIKLPYLSAREKLYLDGLLFKNTQRRRRSELKAGTKLKVRLAKTAADSSEMVSQYFLFYRYYPHYHRIQY
jgi:hypothetical protein